REIGSGLGQVGQGTGGVHVQEHQGACKPLGAQRVHELPALWHLLVGFGSGAGEHRNGVWLEQGGEVVFVHGGSMVWHVWLNETRPKTCSVWGWPGCKLASGKARWEACVSHDARTP